MPATILPVILSGGAGTRLWPLSTADRPKQFHALLGLHTLLQDTALRLGGEADGVRFAPPWAVCSARHVALLESQLAEIGVTPSAVIAEPAGRNTAASALLAAELAARGDPTTLLLSAPSDHHGADGAAFRRAVAVAASAAADGSIVVFGVAPDRADTAYGYIEAASGQGAVRRVVRFTEKPDAATAADWLAEGGRLWNAGLVLARADVLLAEAERFRPDILAAVRAALPPGPPGARVMLDADAFVPCPDEALDRAVLERTDRAVVVELDAGWSDVGSFDALWRTLPHDADGNAGAIVALDARDCLALSDGPRVALVGVEGVSVVVQDGVVLVVGRGADQRVREACAAMPDDG